MNEQSQPTNGHGHNAPGTKMHAWRLQCTKRFIGRIPAGGELFDQLTLFCRQQDIQSAGFSFSGTVSAYTIGSFDARQQVWVTHHHEGVATIVSAFGNLFPRSDGGSHFFQAQVLFSDEAGQLAGGRLFPDTVAHLVEFELHMLDGAVLKRYCNPDSGLYELHV
jgi:predicted DNA-binding protein with PD1-like motif